MKNLKKLVLAFALLGLFVTGCSSSGGEKFTTVEDVKKAGVLKVGTNSGYPPYEFYLTDGGKKELVGYDVDIANAIAKDLGVKVEFVDVDFDSLVPSLMTNKFDIVTAGMVATDDRKKSIDFSENYYETKTVAVAKKANVDKIKDAKDLDGKKIVVQSGTTQVEAAKSVAGANVVEIPSVSDTIAQVLTGQADVLFIAEVSAKNIVAQNPELGYTQITGIDDALLNDGAAVGIKKGDTEMKKVVDETIKKLKDSGELDKLFIKNQQLAEKNKVN